MTTRILAGLAGFALMEPVTYAAHRWVMHGVGWSLHRSHHRRGGPIPGPGRDRPVVGPLGGGPPLRSWRDQLEANDWFPVMFAAGTVTAMAAGTTRASLGGLVPVAVGVTAYGAAYAFVHDVYIHGRFARLPRFAPLEHLRRAHGLHHRYGGEPYGMLCPYVPRALRSKAAAVTAGAPAGRHAPAA